MSMDKKVVLLISGVGMTIGGYLPTLFGADPLGGWSILGGMIGGILGIWLAVWLGKRYG
jgi:hypothetical protein